jgi:EmrB/QacA subfamily drug resistance transporter
MNSNNTSSNSGGHAVRPNLILAFLCIAGFMTFLDVSIVNVSLPTIGRELHIKETYLQYVITTYGTMLGGFLLLGGRVADTFGRRRMLRIGLVVFALASLLAGLTREPMLLIVARGLQGLGSALIAPAALSLLANTFTKRHERARALGIWGAMSGVASVAGVMLGGLLTQGPGWRWVFFINVPIGLVAAAVAPLILRESLKARHQKFDIVGAITLTASLLLLIYTLGQIINWGWTAPQSIGCLVAAGVLLLGFWLIERRATSPLIPLAIFNRKTMRVANVVALFMFGTLATLFLFASLFMQQVLQYSPLQTGLAYLPIAIIISVGAGLSQGLVKKVAAKPVLIAGLVLAIVGMMLLRRMPIDSHYLVDILPAFLIAGLGIGMSFVPLQVAAFHGSSEADSGLAAGLINTAQEAGGALGLALAATIAFSRIPELTIWAGNNADRILAGRATVFHEAFLVGAGFAVISVLVAFTLPMLEPDDGE